MVFFVRFLELDRCGYNELPLYGKEVHTDSLQYMFH